eukprot:sb/3463450/
MEMTTTISAKFATSYIGSETISSKETVFGEFLWWFQVVKAGKFLEAYLWCKPLQSVKEWMCLTSFTLTEQYTDKKYKTSHKYSTNDPRKYIEGWCWAEFKVHRDIGGAKTLTIKADITIIDSYLGQPDVTEAKSNVVIFHRLAKDFFPTKTSRHHASDSCWIAEGRKSEGGITFVIRKYNAEGKLEDLPFGAVLITVRGPDKLENKFGDLGRDIWVGTKINEESVVTFVIQDLPFSYKAEVQKGFNYGKEYLSLPVHGNTSFCLKDSSKIPLNSYIMAENSPVLKEFIEKEGELDHDVSDFDPNSVRIFVDACHSGTLEMLFDTTELKLKVFRDVMKMVTVFKVDWAKESCFEYFRTRLPKPLEDFSTYWDYAVLALDSALTNDADGSLLGHLLSCTPHTKTKFQVRLFPLVTVVTKRSHLDLLMAMLVEFDLVGDFMKQLVIILTIGNKLPLLNYWLKNFNFSLCDEETMNLLTEALEPIISSEVCCKLMTAIDEESKQTDDIREKEDCKMKSIKLIQSDGTLATVARNHWAKIVTSTWPCSKKRPFSLARRNLWENSEIEKDISTQGH